MHRVILAGVVVTVCGAWFAVADDGVAKKGDAGQLPAFEPVMSTHSLMEEQGRHFENMLDLLRDKDAKNRFKRLNHEARALAEMANINGYHKGSREHDDYRGWAAQLKAEAIQFADLAKAHNVDDAKKLARQMSKTCKACHDKYAS